MNKTSRDFLILFHSELPVCTAVLLPDSRTPLLRCKSIRRRYLWFNRLRQTRKFLAKYLSAFFFCITFLLASQSGVYGEATFTGDQSGGISSQNDFSSPPVRTIHIYSLDSPIQPEAGKPGIYFQNVQGHNIIINSGTGEDRVFIFPTGQNASGIAAEARGDQGDVYDDPFLGVPDIEHDPAAAGGRVEIVSYSDILTDGEKAHGLHAVSSSSGYPQSVIDQFESFSESGFVFEVTEVRNFMNTPIPFNSDNTVEVRGYIINQHGDPVTDDENNEIEHGTFVVGSDGSFSLTFTDNDEARHEVLNIGESLIIRMDYTVRGQRNDAAREDVGSLVVDLGKNEEGGINALCFAEFDDFGPSTKPADSDPSLFPDIQQYVEGMLAKATGGGDGGVIKVNSDGALETRGEKSHGIHAHSHGGPGNRGKDSIFYLFYESEPTRGGDGKTPGSINLWADGSIITRQDESIGISAISAGGAGGDGGDGTVYRDGRRGGTGGDGGTVEVIGSGTIETHGDYASGILALSVGGDGGAGGKTGGAMTGGMGGYGGRGGTVDARGSWNITTEGDKAHGIWAKSLGGNAGDGGSGGWLWGDPGAGGQATDGGAVTLYSGGNIETSGLTSYGLYGQSVGGFGGSGGSSRDLFCSFGGDGNSGGSGGDVEIMNLAGGSVTTSGDHSHSIFAQSIGGGGGSGGGEFGLFASLGGDGAAGGFGGDVIVENDGLLGTSGTRAYGIFAQSVGGGGGDGGSVGGLVAIGGQGSKTSNGGNAVIINRGGIYTDGGNSHAIFAQSIGGGGGDGGSSGGLISIGGDGGGGGNSGSVSVTNEGVLHTAKNESHGIFAQSVGGGGGSGGGSISTGVSIGGAGDSGGDGGDVEVYGLEGSSILTEGDRSHGVLAESIGGGGGSGGFAITAGGATNVAIGGDGAKGGDGGLIDLIMDGSIITSGKEAYGIFAQSVGGGGGNGGFSIAANIGTGGLSLALGGGGGGGGIGKNVNVGIESNPITGAILTSGLRSHGIFAQSLGGGGGDGGFSIAGSLGGSNTSANLSFGGQGGKGNQGGDVNVSSMSTITTQRHDAHGIFAQSVGGSGGSGGFSIASSIGGGASLNIAFGGEGGEGSSAGTVSVGSEISPVNGVITTHGDRSYGILAQSVGGGGGAGGSAISGALMGPAAISIGFGGHGGEGGLGGAVNVQNAGSIDTTGQQSHGIFAQSVGGGGGDGGLSITGGVTAFGGLSQAMGGDGGGGNDGGDVSVLNSGNVATKGEYAYGILAQSIGGGGGTGGSSGAVMVNFSSLIPVPPQYPTGSVNISASLGGKGGEGGLAGAVYVDNAGKIFTEGDQAYGIFAQSVGGGGGDGGKAIAATADISMPEGIDSAAQNKQVSVEVNFAMALGGDGADGNSGNEVDVLNNGVIDTAGVGAHGIFAQSVGGGGGSGGDARSMILSIDPSNWVPAEGPPDPMSFNVGATLSLGGTGGAASHGGTVFVENQGGIITRGADAFGILAQSVGGGGGVGGSGYHGLDLEDFGVPEEYAQYQDILPVADDSDLDITLGGSGGSGGDGGAVSIWNAGDISTYGGGSLAILAQSIGGGGGLAGVGATGGDGSVGLGGGGGFGGDGGSVEVDLSGNIHTRGVAAHGIFAQSVGGGGGYAGNIDRGVTDFGINFAMGRGGGDGGSGGAVGIVNGGGIITEDRGAIGIFAQSIGGGGGLGGEIGLGFGFAGSVGGDGDGGRVEVTHSGKITTYGENAHGIFAQSVGGVGHGGDVAVEVWGDISVHGEGAHAVIAQSHGLLGSGDVTVIYRDGTMSGTGSGTVRLMDGYGNRFENHGTVTNADGIDGVSITATTGTALISNYGSIIGSIDLQEGLNVFHNHPGATFNAGGNLGLGYTFLNAGTFSPGGREAPVETILRGDLEQTESGIFTAKVYSDGTHDKLLVTAPADVRLDGTLRIERQTGYYHDGMQYTILELQRDPLYGGVIEGNFSDIILPSPTAILGFDVLRFRNQVVVAVDAEGFASIATNRVERATGDYLDQIAPGASGDLSEVLGELQNLPQGQFHAAFSSLSPDTYDNGTRTGHRISREFSNSLRQRMSVIRPSALAGAVDHDQPILLASAAPVTYFNRDYDFPFLSQSRAGSGVWLDAFGQLGDQDADAGYTGYKYALKGLAAGFDHTLSNRLIGGVSIGYAASDIDFAGNQGDSDIKTFSSAVYGSYNLDNYHFEGSVGYGQNRYTSRRNIDIGGIQREADSRHKGHVYSAHIGGGYAFDAGRWMFGLFATTQFTRLSEESFSEKSAGDLNLLVDSRDTDSLIADVGVRAARVVGFGNGILLPELSAAVIYDFDIDDRVIRASYAGSPEASFSIPGQDVDRLGAGLGAGVTYIHESGLRTGVHYKSEVYENCISHGMRGMVRIEF